MKQKQKKYITFKKKKYNNRGRGGESGERDTRVRGEEIENHLSSLIFTRELPHLPIRSRSGG